MLFSVGLHQNGRRCMPVYHRDQFCPFLFLLFINDIVKDIHSSIRLFADDTSLYIIVDNPQTVALIINSDLGKISKWAINWLVDFHPRKTVSFLVSKKANATAHPPLIMNNTILSE